MLYGLFRFAASFIQEAKNMVFAYVSSYTERFIFCIMNKNNESKIKKYIY